MWHKNNPDNKPSGRVIVRLLNGQRELAEWAHGRHWFLVFTYIPDSFVTHWHERPEFEEQDKEAIGHDATEGL